MGSAPSKPEATKEKSSGDLKKSQSTKKKKSPKALLEDHIVAGREKDALALIDREDYLNTGLDKDGMRPLHIAARAGHVDLVKGLLSRGARLDVKNDSGATPLMFAAAGGYEKICKLILDAGANIRIEDNQSQSALQYAQLHNRSKVENLLQMYACTSTFSFVFLTPFFSRRVYMVIDLGRACDATTPTTPLLS